MTNAPYLLPGARQGYRSATPRSSTRSCSTAVLRARPELMGEGTEKLRRLGLASAVTRRTRWRPLPRAGRQGHQKDGTLRRRDRARSRSPSARATPSCSARTRACVPVPTAEPRRLAPGVRQGGNITAGNASQISDGASVTIVASPRRAERLGVDAPRELLGYGQVAGPDTSRCSPSRRGRSSRRWPRPAWRGRHRPVRDQRGVRRGGWRRWPTSASGPTRS
jgi:acetyl-CoA C-acetyltransferase